MQTNPHFISVTGLVKIYRVAGLEVVALQGLDLEVAQGEIVAGPSGSGKSTLLRTLGGLDRPSAGRLLVDNQNLLSFNQAQLTAYRREQVGFVWQQTTRNLLSYLSARENIELLMMLAGRAWSARRSWTNELLAAVGMAEYAQQRPPQLSGGQQQRIAIACALANRPQILLADEPTGEVDWQTAQRILHLLRDLRNHYGLTIVIVTHDPRVAEQSDRVVAIHDGRTSTETIHSNDQMGAPEVQHGSLLSSQLTTKELVVVDSAGRLQLPGPQRSVAGIGLRARVDLVDGGVLIRPSDEDRMAGDERRVDTTTEPAYYSLYSAAPLPTTADQPKRRWQVWRRKRRT